jgi:hypothetical protein
VSVLPDDVRQFLAGLTKGKTAGEAEADAVAWRDSADLNEAYLAGIIAEAARLLEKYGASP